MSKTIVIVEDDVKLAKLMSDYLINKEQPALVILDVMLPKVDGLTVCREVRQYYDGLIVMLTAQDSDQTEIEGLQIGADVYLKKPIDPPVLLAHIQALSPTYMALEG